LYFAAAFLFAPGPASAQTAAQSAVSVSQTPSVPARITQAIDETNLSTLKGNVNPLARPASDQGAVSDAMPATRLALLLQRSAAQETELRHLLDQQQDKTSPNYHAWLTPQQFGKQFGPADSDVQAITDWLQSHGFQNVSVSPGRTVVEFSGNVGQVRSAFHTDIHQYLVHGEQHLANVSNPQIPAALAPVIAGVRGLDNFRPKSMLRRMNNFQKSEAKVLKAKPLVTLSGCGTSGNEECYGVAPADFAKIYSVPSNLTGSGVNIAIVQDSNLYVSDIQQFRNLFGLPNNFSASNIILDGPDPGVLGPDSPTFDEGEAVLDVEWSGAVAPGANIELVVSQDSDSLGFAGIDLSALYIVNNNLAPIMSESFGACEGYLQSSGATFYDGLWEQAAAQGITAIVSAGDSGSDGCDEGSGFDYATTGLGVNGIASTPFNVALGGTDFQNGTSPSIYWNSPGTPTESAKSYIPEATWNSTCAAAATTSSLNTCTATIINQNTISELGIDLEGGSGGQSIYNSMPSWQAGIAPSADTGRDIPDISLYSAINTSNNSFYITCEEDVPAQYGGQNGNACSLAVGQPVEISPIGGTSAAAPAFAGIMALIVQQQGGNTAGRQGNANYVLYQLFKKNAANAQLVCPSNAATASSVAAGTASCIFYDTITGNNSVACGGGYPNCSNTSTAANQFGVLVDPSKTTNPAYLAVAGYDKATGLGSVNVTDLLSKWGTVTFSSDTPTITTYPTAPLMHGSNASFTVSVTQGSGSVVPTGYVSLIAMPPSPAKPLGIASDVNGNPFTLTNGSVTFQTNQLPGGTNYPVVAHYSGDGTFAAGTSASVNVTVTKEPSLTTVTMWTYDSGDFLYDIAIPAGSTLTYGTTPYIVRVDVTSTASSGAITCYNYYVACPTGNVTETYDSGIPLNDFTNTQTGITSDTAPLNSQAFLEDLPINLPGGSHSVVAAYAGDNSYNASTSAGFSIKVSAAATATTVSASPTSATTTTAVSLTAVIATQSGGNGPTGTVTFSAGGTTLGTASVVPTAASGLNSNTPVAAYGTATLMHTFATAGTYTVSASYGGDSNYTSSASTTSATVSVVVQTLGSFTMALGPTMVATTAGASGTTSSGTSAITITPSGGFSTAVVVTCASIPGVTCTPLTIPAGTTSASLTINVGNPSSSMTAMAVPETRNLWASVSIPKNVGGKGWWALSGSTGLAAVILFFLPGRKRYRAALGLGLACVLSFTLGCGGGSSGGGGGGGGGLTPTTTQLTVSATKQADSPTSSLTVSATVSGGTSTGVVQFYADNVALGSTVPLTNGTTGNITVTAADAPAFLQLVGTHAVTAHYLGGGTTAASASGILDVTITGATSLLVTGTAGTAVATGNVALTIN
jgi:subtilase family serine protease